jgi:hypothetical protein
VGTPTMNRSGPGSQPSSRAFSTYALVMAAFTQRLARLADAGKLHSRLDARRKVLRAEAIKGSHTRMPENIASLMVGVEEFLDFAAENGTIAEKERSELRASAWAALSEQANMQVSQVVGTDPASRFVALIAAAVSAKSANIAGTDGEAPVCATALGWDHRGSGDQTYFVAMGLPLDGLAADCWCPRSTATRFVVVLIRVCPLILRKCRGRSVSENFGVCFGADSAHSVRKIVCAQK